MSTVAPEPARGARSARLQLPLGTMLAFVAAVLAVLAIAVLSMRSNRVRTQSIARANQAHQVLQELNAVLASLKDAETGQRGYLLTGSERYLEPYHGAGERLDAALGRLRALVLDSREQRLRVEQLQASAREKMLELAETIELKREGNAQGALLVVRSDRGKSAMDRLRGLAEDLQGHEQRIADLRTREWEGAVAEANMVLWIGTALLLMLIPAAAYTAARDFRARASLAWLRMGQAAVSASLQGGPALETLGNRALAALANFLDAPLASLYRVDGALLRRVGSFAGPATGPEAEAPLQLPAGAGLLGQAVKQGSPMHVREVPTGYASVASSLGAHRPLELLIAPAIFDEQAYAVLELAFFRSVTELDRQLLARASESIAIAVRTAIDREQLQDLLEETQRQAEELQAQQEELRVSNEELEEQSRALRDTQARLESQQTDLEEYNAQLEEQTQELERQKRDMLRVQAELVDKAGELTRANQYKSEFLANVSHELRTPLNSTLIMAQLLAENRSGNLTDEQVRFAHTISAAGNDLLMLINDILDLSKIEAGKVELRFELVALPAFIEDLAGVFRTMAQRKQLGFEVQLEPGLPASFETDRQRLQQILRNLLSNAFKFTERGTVRLRVAPSGQGKLTFAVSDTGIGIAPEHIGLIFEAFRQADGTTHRKYGGTGLGLSISRDLARLLGGEIALHSEPGRGSTFALELPLTPPPQQPAAGASAPAVPAALPAAAAVTRAELPAPVEHPVPAAPVSDDREQLRPDARVLLVIEDDAAFARIVADLAHERRFQCLLAATADAGIELAQRHQPSAIVLDMVLPDHSGLSVLDRLKRSPRTRHIPVHVISGQDQAGAALAMGAVGYALKPILREQLIDALRGLEGKLTQTLRRVLLVEAPSEQRDRLAGLLQSGQVEVITAPSATDALQRLAETQFDCLVLDMQDPAGHELLQRMSGEQPYSSPPVIVHCTRPLTAEEEARLAQFSRSIIIKDAQSPERVLDEVTLFLHQVEAKLSPDLQRMLRTARDREALFDGRTILVVEDDVRNVFALTRIFEPRGAKVEVARNGREALERLSALQAAGTPPDLVLMDIMMPEMDGLAAMREIRARPVWKALPIIALTAKAMPDDQEKCLAAGASDYVAKPLDVDKLLSLSRVWLSK